MCGLKPIEITAHCLDSTQWYAGELERLHDQRFDFYLHVVKASDGDVEAQGNAVLIVSHAHANEVEYHTHIDTSALVVRLADEGFDEVKTVASYDDREAAGLYFGSMDAAVRRRATNGTVKPVLLLGLPEKLCVAVRSI